MSEELTFDEATHTYKLGDKELISVTTLLKKHGLAPNYNEVPVDILKKASERGKMIHTEIEKYIKDDSYTSFVDEVKEFERLKKCRELSELVSEVKLHNNLVAGTADLICKAFAVGGTERVIVDFKITSRLNVEYVTWQTSIYAYLYEHQCSEKIGNIYVIHFVDGKGKFIKLNRISNEEIERLFECEKNGTIYERKAIVLTDEEIYDLRKIEEFIQTWKEELAIHEKLEQEFKDKLLAEMEKHDIYKFEVANMQITRVPSTNRLTIDSTKLKKEYPEIAEKCTKSTTVKGYVKITI